MATGKSPPGWHTLRVLGAALLLLLATQWFRGPQAVHPGSAGVRLALSHGAPQVAEVAAPAAVPVAVLARSSAQPAWLTDPVGGALDLKRVFDQYIDSGDARLRHAAVRAFAACLPAFMPASNQTPTPEPLIQALPPRQRIEREGAYRALFARCASFLGQDRATLSGWHQRTTTEPQFRAPGAQALEDLLAGRLEQAHGLIAQALSSTDPAAVASLAGLTERLLQRAASEAPDADALLRARAVDAALPLVACGLGLDCSITALASLQLCAAQGWCQGDLVQRLEERAAADGVDRATLDAQRTRLLALLRSGKTPSAADLLAP